MTLRQKNRLCPYVGVVLGCIVVALFSAACAVPPPMVAAVAAGTTIQSSGKAVPTASAYVYPTVTPFSTKPAPAATPALPTLRPILEIPLAGPATFARAELSGLAWYGDHLVLLPQFPNRFGAKDGMLFVLERAEIEDFVAGQIPGPLTPRPLPISAPGLWAQIPGFEGFESIVFDGERVYLTAEASPADGMLGWLLTGRVESDLSVLRIDPASAVPIPPQADLSNMSDEALVLSGSGDEAILLTIYEANGRLVNRSPVAHRFTARLTPLADLPFPAIEYRITDATPADETGRFWAVNYFYPGDVKLKPGKDSLLRLLVRSLPQVERLVELQITEKGIHFTQSPPIYLELLDADARNWEGIARLGERGFLLVTDYHPRTILAYVEK